jgi:hypothetical protein
MSIAEKLASANERNDEALNIALAQELAEMQDNSQEVLELFGIANHGSKTQRHDAIKVLYELAALKPFAFLDKVEFAIDLINSKDNRMVWGAATLIAALAPRFQHEVIENLDLISEKCMNASIIAKDRLLDILLAVVAKHPDAWATIFSLLDQTAPNQLPAYAEKIAPHMIDEHKSTFIDRLEKDLSDNTTEAKRKRIEKVLKGLR